MPGPEVLQFKSVHISKVGNERLFRLDGQWYKRQMIGGRALALPLEPNMAYGSTPQVDRAMSIDDLNEVEVPIDYFEEVGEELDKYPIGRPAVSRGHAIDPMREQDYWSDGCEVPDP